ncbi:MAG: DUF3426 domain-containing protein [Burkholderiaceae bacterium]
MALATTCPQCKTSFKVVPDQLKLRRGLVRCGVCQHVFSGIDYLRYVGEHRPSEPPSTDENGHVDLKTAFFLPETVLDEHPLPSSLQAPKGPQVATAAQAPIDEHVPYEAPEGLRPRQTDDQGADPDAIGSPAGMFTAPGGHERIERLEANDTPDVVSGVDDIELANAEFADLGQATTTDPLAPNAPLPQSHDAADDAKVIERELAEADRVLAEDVRTRADDAHDMAPSLAATTNDDAVDFFSAGSGKATSFDAFTPLSIVAGLALLLLLLVQLAIGARDVLAARYPALQPVLAAVSAPLGKSIELPRRAGSITIDSFELTATPRPGVYSLNAMLRNHASHPVRWPAIELTLTDSVGSVLVRRVLSAEEYLGGTDAIAAGIGASAERPLRVALRASGLSPSGYSAVLFYP